MMRGGTLLALVAGVGAFWVLTRPSASVPPATGVKLASDIPAEIILGTYGYARVFPVGRIPELNRLARGAEYIAVNGVPEGEIGDQGSFTTFAETIDQQGGTLYVYEFNIDQIPDVEGLWYAPPGTTSILVATEPVPAFHRIV